MNLSLTQLVICDKHIIGFVSILTDTIKLNIIKNQQIKNEISKELNISANNEIPAIKIGRFAIDKKYAGNGVGSHVFRNVLLSILNLSKTKPKTKYKRINENSILRINGVPEGQREIPVFSQKRPKTSLKVSVLGKMSRF